MHFAGAARKQGDDRVGNEAEAEARSDVVGEGHPDDREEGGNRHVETAKADVHAFLHHEGAHENEDRSGRVDRDDRDERDEEERESEEARGEDVRKARTRASDGARGAFEVARGGRGPEDRREHRADRVGNEGSVEIADGAVVLHEARLAGDADEHPHVVEEVHHRKGEDDGEESVAQGALEVELKEGLRDVGETRREPGAFGKRGVARDDAERRRRENADDHGGADAHHVENRGEEEAKEREEHLGVGEVAERDRGRFVRDDDPAVLEADEGDEGADPHDDCVLEILRDRVDDPLSDARDGEEKEDHARDEDGAETGLPAEARGAADVVREEGGDAEARGHDHRIVRPESHDKGHDDRRQNDGARDGGAVHAGVGEHGGNHEDKVAARHEGRETAEKFLTNGSSVFSQAKEAFKKTGGLRGAWGGHVRFARVVKRKKAIVAGKGSFAERLSAEDTVEKMSLERQNRIRNFACSFE